jgi:hypothetical protein
VDEAKANRWLRNYGIVAGCLLATIGANMYRHRDLMPQHGALNKKRLEAMWCMQENSAVASEWIGLLERAQKAKDLQAAKSRAFDYVREKYGHDTVGIMMYQRYEECRKTYEQVSKEQRAISIEMMFGR